MTEAPLTLEEFQRRAGKARWARLTAEQRRELAARGGKARWAKAKRKKKARKK